MAALLFAILQDASVHHRELQPLYTLAATAAYVVLLAVTATTYSQAASLANSTAPLISQSTSSRRLSAGLDWEEQVSLDDAAGVLERLLQPIRQWRPQLQEQLAGLGDAPLTIRQMELELLSQLAVVHTWAATPDGAYCGGRINQQHAAAGRAAFSKALELSDGEFYNAGVLAALSNLLRRTGAEAEGQAALRRAVAAARAAGDSFRELNAASALATAIPGQDGWSYREVEGLVVVMQRCLQDCKPWLPSRLWSNHRESGLCSGCGGHSTELKFCARCRTAQYCSRACQAQHWRAGHKADPRAPASAMGRAAAVVLLAAVGFAALVAAAEFSPNSIPDWVYMGKQRPTAQEDLDFNYQDVAVMNGVGKAYDLVLWGDSLTADMRDWRADAWDDFFPPGELLAQPLGMGGSTVQELAARIIKDGERPDIDPKAIVLWVGTNNVKQPNAKNANPADKLDWLIQWLQHNMPNTKLAVSGLIPNDAKDVGPTNEEYKAMAEARGVLFFDCTEGLDPSDKEQYEDGTHLTRAGQRVWLECMRPAVQPLLAGNATA
ncbi:hypothetical protein COHA_007880 [Chlorella ohadii]|uniref:MYND-type domain-containing protein n=1 Tax=Chlorella ohadii TaxID=2649997 RepID=A0AAD5GZD6_9CHLO|nr:hypothetical protein COHA_007880 [Chlorella ohadii]